MPRDYKKEYEWDKNNSVTISIHLHKTDKDIIDLIENEGKSLPKASRVKSLLRELIELRAYYNRD